MTDFAKLKLFIQKLVKNEFESIMKDSIVSKIQVNCLKITRIFQFWHFPTIFVLIKVTCLVTLFDRKLQVFKNSPKLRIFGIFNELLSTQNVNVALNVE